MRQAQGDFRQFGEPILDWFHVAMRMIQLSQAIKGLPADRTDEPDPPKHIEECLRNLRRAKAYLWHGSPHRALQTLEDLTWEIATESDHAKAVQDKLEEFMGYVTANLTSIPNYADRHRHRHGEPIATGFVESAVNQVVSKRLVKKQAYAVDPNGSPPFAASQNPRAQSAAARRFRALAPAQPINFSPSPSGGVAPGMDRSPSDAGHARSLANER